MLFKLTHASIGLIATLKSHDITKRVAELNLTTHKQNLDPYTEYYPFVILFSIVIRNITFY